MNKNEYINELTKQLKKLPSQEIEEILSDYREHFEIGQRSGKTEEDISKALGHPRSVAQGYLVSSLVNEAKTSSSIMARSKILFRIMLVMLVLAPFNFLVIVGPFLILFALTLAGWAVPVAIGGVSIAIMGAFFTAGPAFTIGIYQGLSLLFMFLGALGLAALGALIMILVSKLLTQLVASYLRWNINFITARRA
jgi:uncharacterized membrane protein